MYIYVYVCIYNTYTYHTSYEPQYGRGVVAWRCDTRAEPSASPGRRTLNNKLKGGVRVVGG